MTDNIIGTTGNDDAGNEFESFGATTEAEQAALTERVAGEQQSLAEAEAQRIANEEAAAERDRQREAERALATEREHTMAHAIARVLNDNLSALRLSGKLPFGAWASNGIVMIPMDQERQYSLYVDERVVYSYSVHEAILTQAKANGHMPTSWGWSGALGRVSGCDLCDALVRITEEGVPKVDAYNKRCPKAATKKR